MVKLKTSLGLLKIEPKEYTYSELSLIIKRKFKITTDETQEIIKELIDKRYITEIEAPSDLETSLGLLKIEPKEYTYTELRTNIIKTFNLKFPFSEAHALIGIKPTGELIKKGYIRRFTTPEGLIRYELMPKYKLAQVFRLLKARMYYANKIKRGTPTPFAEARVVVFTMNPEGWEKTLDEALDRLEWIFYTISEANKQNRISVKIEGLEVEPVDFDEVTAPLDQIQRYYGLYNTPEEKARTGDEFKFEKEESKIARIYEPLAIQKYRGWISNKAEEGKLKPELLEKHKKLEGKK